MPNKKNLETVSFLKDKINECAGLIFFDYRGASVLQLTNLRKELAKGGCVLKICKNSLVNIALKDLGRDVKDDFFINPTAVAFAGTDVPLAAKVISDVSKKNDKIKIKGGYLGEDSLDADTVKIVASIPPREVLLSHLVTALESPISSFVYSTGSIISSLVYTLEAVKEKKSA